MDTDELSLEAYGIVIKADEISGFLKTDLGILASRCKNEQEFLKRAFIFIKKIRKNQEPYLDDWLLEKRFDDKRLIELLEYIRIVNSIPMDIRTPPFHSGE